MKSTLDIRIEEDLKQKLREIAKKRHRSMTQQIEHWIEHEYNEMLWGTYMDAQTILCGNTPPTEE